MKNLIKNLLATEPSLVLGALTALIALAVGFGLHISPEQVSLILAAVAAVMSVILRRTVTSPATAKVKESELGDLTNLLADQEVQFKLLKRTKGDDL